MLGNQTSSRPILLIASQALSLDAVSFLAIVTFVSTSDLRFGSASGGGSTIQRQRAHRGGSHPESHTEQKCCNRAHDAPMVATRRAVRGVKRHAKCVALG